MDTDGIEIYFKIFEIIMVASVLGLITGALGHKKGDSFILWWLFGTFLFIVALPLVLIMDAKNPQVAGRNSGLKNCPYCNTLLKTGVMKCPQCRRSQPAIGAATEASWQQARAAGDDVAQWAKQNGADKNEDDAPAA